GYRYKPWVGRTYYARPATYGVGAGFAAGTFTGFALGLATAAIVGNQFWGPHWDGRRDGRRDNARDNVRDSGPRGSGGRQQAGAQRPAGGAVTVNNVTTNVYNNWGNRAVVRQSNAQPVAAPANLRERQQQVERLRADSQRNRERSAQQRQAQPAPGAAPGAAAGTAPAAAAAAPRNYVFVAKDGNP
ncbi:MAG: hypothetical protein IT562_23535, partial [Alphaproteobacteria bacterium]|nr:hypothetical protein [Alphaproteobacteria bacterium]